MQWLVGVVRPVDAMPTLEAGVMQYSDRKQYVSKFMTDKAAAMEIATAKAKANPGTVYAVFGIVEIVEALPPAEPKIVHKHLNEAGEIVVKAEEANGA